MTLGSTRAGHGPIIDGRASPLPRRPRRPTPTPYLPQVLRGTCPLLEDEFIRRPLAVFGVVALPVLLRSSASAVFVQHLPPHRHPGRAMLSARPPIQELEMQTLREPAGVPVDQDVQGIASPDPLARHVPADARVGVDMVPNRADTVAPDGPYAHHRDERNCGLRKANQFRRVVQRDLQEQPTAIRERPNDPNVNRDERVARRATNDPGTGVPVLELFEPETLAQPTPEGRWGRTGRDGGRTGFSGGRTGTGGRLGFSGSSGFSGGPMGFSGGSTGFDPAIGSLP